MDDMDHVMRIYLASSWNFLYDTMMLEAFRLL